MIDQTISHYKILEKLGEGGMGVVYKAHDITLDRDVALKFLPHDVSLSEEERNRFIHEAKAASALEHPNICTIHEVGETPDGQMFIVMGYYEGRSISKMVEKGRLDVAEAVSIAIQIAEGLQAAHGKGIVHRDIKSSNIIVSDQGQVRILDFGLARKKGLSKLTKTGTTVGTAAYMSPEQARGESIDQRTDLWSLGVVLYEMVTGKLPFRGEHEAAILYSVVNEEPKSLEVSVSATSPELIHIIGRALEKDVAERYHTAAEVLVDLKRLKKETSRTGYQSVKIIRRKPRVTQILLSVMAIAVLFVAGYLFFLNRSVEINPGMVVHPLQIPFKEIFYPGISGDGNWIAFSATDQNGKSGLYLMHSMGGEPRLITQVSTFAYADISTDGSIIAYNSLDPERNSECMYIVPTNGGTPRKIGPGAGGRFQPGGGRLGFIRGFFGDQLPSGKIEFWSAAIDGSDIRREFIDTVHIGYPGGSVSFCYSPDGKKVAWIRSFPEWYEEIVIHNLETGEEMTITSDKKRIDEVTWARENQIVYTTDKSGVQNIWMVSARGGAPVQITRETTPARGVKSSADGQKLLYYQARGTSDFWIASTAENKSQQITFREEDQNSPAFSPDGKKIAFIVGGSPLALNTSPSHLYVMDKDGNNRRQLTYGDESVSQPWWSPDGRRIAYGSRKFSEPADSFRTYIIEPSNPESPKYIARGTPGMWIDSARLHIWVNNTAYITSVDGALPTPVYEDSTRAFLIQGGKYIVFHDLHIGKDVGFWIVDGTKPRDVQRKTARLLPWHSDDIKLSGMGNVIYSGRGTGEIWRMVLPDGKEERIKGDFSGVAGVFDFYPSWDGKEVIIVKQKYISNVVMIENLFK